MNLNKAHEPMAPALPPLFVSGHLQFLRKAISMPRGRRAENFESARYNAAALTAEYNFSDSRFIFLEGRMISRRGTHEPKRNP